MPLLLSRIHPSSLRFSTKSLRPLIQRTNLDYIKNLHRLPTTPTMASSNIPKTMRGILIEKTGGVEVLQYRTDLPVPEPKEGELLVKNEYIGINYIDT